MSTVDNRSERKKQSDKENFSRNHTLQRTTRKILNKAIVRVWQRKLRPKGSSITGREMAARIDPTFPQYFLSLEGKLPTKSQLNWSSMNGDKWIDGEGLNPTREACRRIANELIADPRPRSDEEMQSLCLAVEALAKTVTIIKREGCIHIVSLTNLSGCPTKVGYTDARDPEDRIQYYERRFGAIERWFRIKVFGVGNAAKAEERFHTAYRKHYQSKVQGTDTECYHLLPTEIRDLVLQTCADLGFEVECLRWYDHDSHA